jgi:hypothetical protein
MAEVVPLVGPRYGPELPVAKFLLGHYWAKIDGIHGIPSREKQLRAATQAIHRFLRRFAVFLTSGALVGVGGGRLAESAADRFSPVYR